MARNQMMSLGDIVFSIEERAYEELTRSTEFRWPQMMRLGRRPAHQWLGIGADTIDLRGVVYPHHQPYGNEEVVGITKIEEMRTLAGNGVPYELVDGMGRNHGRWVILSIRQVDSVFFDNGAPRKQEFEMSLSFYGEDDLGGQAIIFSGNKFSVPRIQNNPNLAGNVA